MRTPSHTHTHTPPSRPLWPASSDNTARLWDLEEGESVKVYSGHAKAVTAVALNDFGE